MQRSRYLRQSGKSNTGPLLVALLAAAGIALWFVDGVFFYRAGTKEPTLSEARGMENPVPNRPEVLAEGKALYGELCAHCHGDEGRGDGPESMMYDPAPADFTSEHTAGASDGELFYKITEGRKPMPSFKRTLTDQQRWTMVRYVRSFAQKQE